MRIGRCRATSFRGLHCVALDKHPTAAVTAGGADSGPTVSLAGERLDSGHCPLRLLGPEDEGKLPSTYEGNGAKLVDTYRTAMVPPLICAAVQRAVFACNARGHVGEEGWVDPDDPDLVDINLESGRSCLPQDAGTRQHLGSRRPRATFYEGRPVVVRGSDDARSLRSLRE